LTTHANRIEIVNWKGKGNKPGRN